MPRSAKSPALPGGVAVLAVALVLSLPSFSAATAAPAPASKAASASDTTPARHYTRAQATRIFERLQRALKPKHAAPRRLGDPLPRRDLSLLMRDAQLAKSSMTARQASIIDSSSRPVPDAQGCTDYTPLLQAKWVALASAHFCVHYRPTLAASAGGATAAQAQTTLDTMEYVYAKEVSTLGYQSPLADSDGKVDVFLDQIGDQGYYGFCTNDAPTPTSTAWCGLDNDFAVGEFGAPPLNSLRVTAAHEFFHAIQFAYNDGQDSWFMEGSAVWMEDIVYPAINDYLQYLVKSQVVNPRWSTDYLDPTRLSVYGTVTLFKYLSERFKDNGIIRQIWSAATPASGRDGIQAVVAVLRARGYSFAPEFARYGVWNTLPQGSYADRSLWPSPGVWQSSTLTRRRHDTGLRSVGLNHLANAPMVVRPGSSLPPRAKLRVIVDAPNSSHGSRASVEIRFRSGTVKTYVITLNGAGNGSKRFGFNRRYVKSAVVVLTNASVGYNNQTFRVRAQAVS